MMSSTQTILLEAAIIKAMGARPGGIMTYVIRNILEMEHGYHHERSVTTATVLRRLKAMERRGEIERVRSSYAVMLCWRRKLV